MLPSIVAHELQLSLHDYLRAAFPISTPHFRGDDDQGETALIDRFLATPGKLLKGPYLSLGLPFRRDDRDLPFRHVDPGFPPYRHQQQAFQRLCGEVKHSTLVATGTGSGKTECFLLPILDHCAGLRADPAVTEKRGIKALIIYPMNALASDQARRVARLVNGLGTKLTVGLFTGDNPEAPAKSMSPEGVITDKETLRQHPPDILLTNYKMLDFLLMRPKDQPLWRYNAPGILRYLVVDELHTFDGAQGTDLACLIRRLRERLRSGDELACVGTSATIGDATASQHLRDYAASIFATGFDDDSLVLEDRLSADEYLTAATDEHGEVSFHAWPESLAERRQLDPQRFERPEAYLAAAYQRWFVDGGIPPTTDVTALSDADHPAHAAARVALGRDLKRHDAFHRLLRDSEGVTDLKALLERWKRERQWAGEPEVLLHSLLALVSAAREPLPRDDGEPLLAPLLTVRLQLWLRELSRMVARVDGTPELVHADDDPQGRPRPGMPLDEQAPLRLPLIHCRDCHAAAWGTLKAEDARHVSRDLSAFYRGYFQQSPDVCLLYPLGEAIPPSDRTGQVKQLCPTCAALTHGDASGPCPACGTQGQLRVWQPALQERRRERLVAATDHCPWCRSRGGLSILGFRAASLASTLLARLYQSPYNDDRKTIAFSDSVQDAAHRAGFFEARTWRQALRQALDGWLTSQGQGLSLDRLASTFALAMRRQAGSDADFVGRWLAPNMAWLKDADSLQQHGSLPAGSDLPELVTRRLDWEVHSELGLRSQIGRTLERQGRVTLGVDTTLLEAAAERLAGDWAQELPGIGEVTAAQAARFLLGVLHRLRTRGGFEHPEVEGYARDGGETWFFRRSLCLPNYGPRAAPPAFLTLEPVSKNFDTITGARRPGGGGNWYAGWFLKQLGADQVLAGDLGQAYRLALRALEREGLVRSLVQLRGREVWALTRPHWRAVTQPLALRCSACGQRHQAPPDQLMLWQGLACLQPQCRGRLEPAAPFRWALAPSPRPPTRLVSHEHTGLLDADTRAWVEHSFITGDRPWDINLLSATPTLEMGIDIGDLSSVLLCSTPPAQANYLQRIGRAGRRDGNALNVTIANAAPHDLYFYAEPLEMMAGSVQPPGVFLQATAVLERQLLAYAFDHWVADAARDGTLDEKMLPGRLSSVLDNITRDDRRGFPWPLLEYVSQHQAHLFEGFCALFPTLGEEAIEHLRRYLEGNNQDTRSLEYRIVNRLRHKANQRQSWRDTIRDYKNQLERRRKQPQDDANEEAMNAINTERRALMDLARRLDAQHTLNFFTDEGLLPNYAFPEEGVTLNGVVIRSVSRAQRETEGEKSSRPYEVVSYDFQRPAQSALVELAPENTFYAVGRALKIDQVNLRLSDIESWRLCNHCHYSENLANGDIHGACPRCGSPQWGDGAQKRQLLRLREVTANVRDRDSRIGDDSEQREPSFYTRQLLTDIAPGSARFAYRIDDPECPFGFEYVPKAHFLEINFGRHDDQAPSLAVAGDERPRSGFRVCQHCGKVQRAGMKAHERHQRFCQLARPGAIEQEGDFIDSLFLYRELESEALRLLLPLSDVAISDVARHSLIAALHLGLKAHFHGNVDHLRITEQQTPGQAGGPSRHYLVLHDSVPGGTGYLKELMQSPETLLAMLDSAHHQLASCGCQQDPTLDGCYRCLLAYRESRHMAKISRRLALELLERILNRRESLVAIDGLEDVDLNALVESELEQRFIDLLPSLDAGIRLVPELVAGNPGWRLTLETGREADGSPRLTSWRIEPQRNLGPGDGVVLPTRPDFMLWPGGEANRAARPLALYLDGFQFHYERLDDDTAKRQAVLASNRFQVWTLGWRDLDGAPPEVPLWQRHPDHHLGQLYDALADKLGLASRHDGAKALHESSLTWLLAYLRDPADSARQLGEAALGQAFHWLDPRTLEDPALRHALDLELAENAPPGIHRALLPDGSAEGRLLGGALDALGSGASRDEPAGSEAAVSISAAALQDARRLSRELQLHLSLDDRHLPASPEGEGRWRAFWHAANLLQFLPRFSLCSVSGVANGVVTDAVAECPALAVETDEVAEPQDAISAEWQALIDDELTLLPPEWVTALAERGLPLPTPGLDVLDAFGEASMTLELAWEGPQVAVAIEEDLPAGWRKLLADWRIVTPEDDNAIERLADWLSTDERSEP
ncbi:DEAD/DEAH box helicase [Halomonas urmiana]|uniref:DEAD/DEAH box helicase n=1 Tax=Halomonas urmiana TaxID=490901 RepID=A0A5R8M8T6_9GAMM|nr:DEAD/DEAH box helicase [Halomonas urmiana]TLF45936.1 DEAD/DEAH box helicase [Halomonas urmiana]